MSVTVMIPTALRTYADGEDTVTLDGANVGDILKGLTDRFPSLRPHLFSDDGELRNFVNVFVNDENIRDQQQAATTLNDGDEVAIVPAVAGGSAGAPAIAALPDLSKEEVERYARHLILPEVGMEGQKKLKAASILLIGAGGLGSPLGMYLSAAGVGRLGIVDFDNVDFSNLQRQVIHGTERVGRSKAESAKQTINSINPNVQVDLYQVPYSSENAFEIAEPYDIVIDGTDNFPTRYLVNDVCVLTGKPNVYGAIFRFDGQATVFGHDGGPCYRCLYPEPPDPGLVPSCAEGGVLGILPGIVGLIQATEAIKIILGTGTTLTGRLLMFDALAMKFREMKIRRDPACPICGDEPTIRELIDYKQFCGVAPETSEAAKVEAQTPYDISARELKDLLDAGEDIFILDVRNPNEYEICHLEGTLIPVSELESRLEELDRDADIIVHCKMGGRSARACEVLKAQGFERVRNLQGGILAWAEQVDPSVPKY
ncbi:MAG: molybdopterin-synthase adenylyltransferase MoeB [Phycisphaerae bacterium]|nr:molybdopterin-synthase adenylyltransferase MoeB [Phycisphaerae bacterium]